MTSPTQPVRLDSTQPQEHQLAEGETHLYQVPLEAGEYIRIVAEKRGVDLVLSLWSPGDERIAEIESPTGVLGAERISEVAAVTGDYRVEVAGGEGTPAGTYEIRIEEKGPASAVRRRLVAAERIFREGEALRRESKFAEAIIRYEQSMALWQEVGDPGYFAARQYYWELFIDILLALDRLHPNQGFATHALEADEKRRAHNLLDAMAEVRTKIRQYADPTLLQEEEQIQRQLDSAENSEDIKALLERLEFVRIQMRQSSPHLARLEGTNTLALTAIQKRLLDADTLLLVYSLGEERSVLWRVTRSTLASHQLPERERIEAAARLAHDLLSQRLRPGSGLRQKAVDDLAALVLKPVAADLPKYRRLLIVADGTLQLVPFSALSDPAAAPLAGRQPLLVESHSIIMLPSASVGAALRQEQRTRPLRKPGPLIAVLADPVFDASDPRVHSGSVSPQPKDEAAHNQLTRSLRDLEPSELDRLPFSRQEAEAIQHLWRPSEVLSVFDFAASREVLNDERLRQAPILHLATHGFLDDLQPELSGLVFSLVNPNGSSRSDGFLPLHEIYGLALDAEMIVLSACQTKAGKEMRGEGLLGMTLGFISIGVTQLVVSLWKVEDRAKAELMARFYRNLFDGARPPEALQRAQNSMLGDPLWSDPSLWAGFIFLGDHNRRPGGGIEAADSGGAELAQRAGTGGLPPPKLRPKPPKREGKL